MTLRVYDAGAWKSPTNFNVYDGSWKTVKVAYTYALGVWKVVYPDPITPLISVSSGPFGDRQSVYVNLNITNADYIVAQLYSGTTQTTLLDTQTIQTNENAVDSVQVRFSGLSNNTTYNMKVVAYSITETPSTAYLSGAVSTINVIAPTASITSINVAADLKSVTVNWNSTNQDSWRVIIRRTSDSAEMYRSSLGTASGPSVRSVTATFDHAANTSYTVQLDVSSTSNDGATATQSYTTPNAILPVINSFSSTGTTCNTASVTWSGSNYTSGQVQIWTVLFSQTLGVWQYSTQVASYSFTTQTSYTFTGLSQQTMYGFKLILTSSTGDSRNSDNGGDPSVVAQTTSQSAPSPPSNFSAVSNTYGNGVTLSWTAPSTGSCVTSNDGYTIQYKLSSDTNWSLVSNTISSASTTYDISTAGITLTANTAYDFRIFTRSSPSNSTYAYSSVTTNNTPYSISMYTLPIAATTFSTVTVYAQLKNISGGNATSNGITVTFSATAGRGSFSSTTANTSSGLASVSYTTNSTTGNINFSSTASGVPLGGSVTLVVGLSPALTPALSVTRTNFGYDVSHTNYNSLWSYSANPAVWSGNVNSTAFGYYIQVLPLSSATISQDANNVYCSSVGWVYNPSLSATVTSTRTGYNDGSASVSGQPATGYTSYLSYDWYYYSGGAWQLWGSGQTRGKGSFYTTNIKGKPLICNVTAARDVGGTKYGSNTIASNIITAN